MSTGTTSYPETNLRPGIPIFQRGSDSGRKAAFSPSIETNRHLHRVSRIALPRYFLR